MVEEPKPLKKQAQIKQDEAYARELEAELNKNINWDDVIEQVKEKGKQDNAALRYQALKRKPQTEAHARKNMMVYLKNMARFKMDYFKGMSYDEIRPIFEKYFNSNVAFLEKSKEQLEEEESRALKRQSESSKEKAAKKQNKTQKLETVRVMWSSHYSFYNHSDDPASRAKISIDKVYFGSNAQQSFKLMLLKTSRIYSKGLLLLVKDLLLLVQINAFDNAADSRLRRLEQSAAADYALWDVIENGATLQKIITEGVVTEMPITTTKEKAHRRLKVKAISNLIIGIPNDHLKFDSIKDVKKLMEAVEKRFSGNAATRKTQRNLLKQQYKNFTAPSSERLDQTFDRLQKLVSQLELLDEKLLQEDVNQKLLRNLSPEWNTHAVVWRNKADLDTMSMDDLYNNLKVYEPEVKGMKLTVNGNETIGFDKSKVKCYNCHKRGHFDREWRASRNQDNKNKESSRSVPIETYTSIALVSCDGLGRYDWSDQAEEGPNYALMAFSSSRSNSEVSNDSIYLKSCLETVELLKSQNDQLLKDLSSTSQTRNFMPPTPDLSFNSLDEFVNEPIVKNCKAMSSEDEPKVGRKYDDALSIEEWVSKDEKEDVSQPKIKKKTVRPSIVKIECFKSK
uniref:Uncharacterized protein n=1 Tax=Tanacetum cinerariifolium TaxID=118510 RepID=A0A6L2KZ99_TANCI|nr:hypothetical protein [Tanacetum cinerariifolium]